MRISLSCRIAIVCFVVYFPDVFAYVCAVEIIIIIKK